MTSKTKEVYFMDGSRLQLFFNEWVTRWNRKQVIKAAINKLNRVYSSELK